MDDLTLKGRRNQPPQVEMPKKRCYGLWMVIFFGMDYGWLFHVIYGIDGAMY